MVLGDYAQLVKILFAGDQLSDFRLCITGKIRISCLTGRNSRKRNSIARSFRTFLFYLIIIEIHARVEIRREKSRIEVNRVI